MKEALFFCLGIFITLASLTIIALWRGKNDPDN